MDRSELNNLAERDAKRIAALRDQWKTWAESVGAERECGAGNKGTVAVKIGPYRDSLPLFAREDVLIER